MSPRSNSYPPEKNSGSPNQGEPEFLVVGKLRRPHGLRGQVLSSVWTDFPERLGPGITLYVGNAHTPVEIKSVHWHGQDMLISFEEYTDREQVGVFRNQTISVKASDVPDLEEGEYYLHELIGLKVFHVENNAILGTVEKIIETGAPHDVFLVLMENGKELLLPDIEDVVLDIDMDSKEMHVKLIDGLFPQT
jgi:16S rRNA processing protein RimM